MPRDYNCCAALFASPSAPDADHGDVLSADQSYGRNDEWHDPVTGLPRPRGFLEHLERLLAAPGRPPRSVAMLVLEVADFHGLRAQFGRSSCDELLRAIAERLHEEVPEPNLVTRLRCGEFAIVLHDLGPEVAPETLATRLLERASEPGPNGDRPMRWEIVGALAAAEGPAESAIQLFERASRALARARLRSRLTSGIARSSSARAHPAVF